MHRHIQGASASKAALGAGLRRYDATEPGGAFPSDIAAPPPEPENHNRSPTHSSSGAGRNQNRVRCCTMRRTGPACAGTTTLNRVAPSSDIAAPPPGPKPPPSPTARHSGAGRNPKTRLLPHHAPHHAEPGYASCSWRHHRRNPNKPPPSPPSVIPAQANPARLFTHCCTGYLPAPVDDVNDWPASAKNRNRHAPHPPVIPAQAKKSTSVAAPCAAWVTGLRPTPERLRLLKRHRGTTAGTAFPEQPPPEKPPTRPTRSSFRRGPESVQRLGPVATSGRQNPAPLKSRTERIASPNPLNRGLPPVSQARTPLPARFRASMFRDQADHCFLVGRVRFGNQQRERSQPDVVDHQAGPSSSRRPLRLRSRRTGRLRCACCRPRTDGS